MLQVTTTWTRITADCGALGTCQNMETQTHTHTTHSLTTHTLTHTWTHRHRALPHLEAVFSLALLLASSDYASHSAMSSVCLSFCGRISVFGSPTTPWVPQPHLHASPPRSLQLKELIKGNTFLETELMLKSWNMLTKIAAKVPNCPLLPVTSKCFHIGGSSSTEGRK